MLSGLLSPRTRLLGFFAVLRAVLLTVYATNIVAQAPKALEQGSQSETPVTVTGVLSVICADDFASRRSDLVHIDS